MELEEQGSTKSGTISEYKEARDRFNKFSEKVEQSKDYTDSEFNSNSYLDQIISKLCEGDESIDIGNDSSLFYELIFYSDFIQIKKELLEIFYSKLCEKFIFTHLVNDITKYSNKLDEIAHVKEYIIQGFCKILQVVAVVVDDVVILKYSEEKLWSNVNLKNVNQIHLHPCAFKVMMHHDEFDLIHLNLIFKLLEAENINLKGCNLNGRNTTNLFKDLKLKRLDLSECGTSVNEIIENNFVEELSCLTHLNISKNPLFNKTLENLRSIPVKSLDISGCIKISGSFVNSIWFAERFTVGTDGENAKGDIDILWEQGVLKENIEVLNVSNNKINLRNLQKILQLQLKELNISGGLENFRWSELTFPESLRILKSKRNDILFDDFQALCKIHLETLEINYCGKPNEDFFVLNACPLKGSLKDLFVCVSDPCEDFISFISKLNLERFECELASEDCSIDSFIAENSEEKKRLKYFTITGPVSNVTEEFISKFKELNLTELSLSLPCSFIQFSVLLCCENIQKSIVKLSLDEEDVKTEDLIQILKFKKLEILSFQYSQNIDIGYLKRIESMSTLKTLKLKAVVRGELNLNLAHALCIVPVETLIIYDDYSRSISDEAFEYLSSGENSVKFSKNLVSLQMRAVIKPNMATVLRNCNWKIIDFHDCSATDDALKIILDNKNLVFTLHHLKLSNLDLDWGHIARLNLSKLEVEMFDLPSSALPNLVTGSISKFLRYFFLENYKCEVNLHQLLQTSLSEVNCY